jgi:hypothetical protein
MHNIELREDLDLTGNIMHIHRMCLTPWQTEFAEAKL